MGGGVNSIQNVSMSGMDLTYTKERDLLIQCLEQLAGIRERLEPLTLHHCTEDTLSCLVFQLQEIVKAIQPLSSQVIETYVIPKKALLRDLRSALIELLLAQDQLAIKGRTSRFYKHLLICQEYLSCAFDTGINDACSQSEIKFISTFELSQKASLEQIQKHYTDFLKAQGALENANSLFKPEVENSIEQVDCVNEALNALYTLVRELGVFSHSQAETFGTAYQFYINIAYLEEQIPRLLERIKTFYSAYYSFPKRVQKISREIAYNLDAIVHSSREVSPALTALFKSPRLQKEHEHHLRLIHSSLNR